MEEWELNTSRHNRTRLDNRKDGFALVWEDDNAGYSERLNRVVSELPGMCALLTRGMREVSFTQTMKSRFASSQVYHECFASWTSVESLHVAGSIAAHSVIDGLISRLDSDGRQVFPRLRVLEFTGVEWEGTVEDMGDALQAKLVKALQERHRTGMGLEVLLVPDITALREQSWWDALQEIVRVEGTASPA